MDDISLSSDASNLIISISTEWLNNGQGKKNIFLLQNTKTGEGKQILISSEQFQGIKNAKYSADGKGFYFLAIKPDAKSFINDGGYTKTQNTLFYYDLQTEQSKELWSVNNKTITNYEVLNK
ncbi:hypothetical protein DEAC_c18130 [Desulfosporosinus acididurans]|uniref:Protein TolB n=1 Tax=Desulfosporosinus acididurans TaxID=476652 RepID=A0A0J1FSG1_9FIRM|nr:hypothetical protein [Desulfosporosinus acididurans]KLU66414.1 hypothetical protein DEAC_c18130 [Desulfosporosinus acididurans]